MNYHHINLLFSLILAIAMPVSGMYALDSTSTTTEGAYSVESSADSCENLKGKVLWSIFDSLGEGNVWQNELCRLSGMVFYPEINYRNISYGGTNSAPRSAIGSLGRAKKLVQYKDSLPIDIVIFENVNDMNDVNNSNIVGTLDDEPWMQGEKIIASKGVFVDYKSAREHHNNGFSQFLLSTDIEKRKVGAMVVYPYKASNGNGYNLKVENTPTADGDIYITVEQSKFKINVKASMSIEDIVTLILNVPYNGGWGAVNNGDCSVNISYYTTSDATITVETNNTGLDITVEETFKSKEFIMYYTGKTAEDWCDETKWKESISLYSCYKGMFEYLIENLPETDLYVMLPSYYNVNFNDNTLKNEDGTYNEEIHYNSKSQVNRRKLAKIQTEVAELYDIPVLDIHNSCNINLQNIETYYYSSNVHPKPDGYKEWSKTLYEMFKEIYATNIVEIFTIDETAGIPTDYAFTETTTVGTLNYTRKLMDSSKWNPLYVPFSIAISEDFSEKYDVATVAGFNESGDVLTMELALIDETATELTAGTPYLIRAKNEDARNFAIEYSDVELSSNDEYLNEEFSTASYSFSIKGSYSKMVYGDEDFNNALVVSTSGSWQHMSATAYLRPYRFYVIVYDKEGNPVDLRGKRQTVSVRLIDGATGIEAPAASATEDEVIFDLQGRRVENPSKGLYIVNGKKVYLK